VPHLNRTKPFTYMTGMEPICFRQGGSYFLRNGDYAGDATEAVQVTPPEPPLSAEAEAQAQPTMPSSRGVAKVPADDMRLAINKALKARMADYDEPWQGVEHARQFLGIS
jgi:hypothetical protein